MSNGSFFTSSAGVMPAPSGGSARAEASAPQPPVGQTPFSELTEGQLLEMEDADRALRSGRDQDK